MAVECSSFELANENNTKRPFKSSDRASVVVCCFGQPKRGCQLPSTVHLLCVDTAGTPVYVKIMGIESNTLGIVFLDDGVL